MISRAIKIATQKHNTSNKIKLLTPCTHAYDHITQHIDNLEDLTQQHTVYTNEVDVSLFTIDTTTLCDYNIMTSMPNSNNPQETKTNITQSMGIHS